MSTSEPPAEAVPEQSGGAPPGLRRGRRRGRRGRPPAPLRIGGGISPVLYVGIAVCVFAAILILWIAATSLNRVEPLFLPSPGDVVHRLSDLASDGTLWADARASIRRILVGFLLATAMAVPLGVLMGSFGVWDAAMTPITEFLRYIPPAAIVPLAILWIGFDESYKYLIIWIGTFFFETLLIMDAVRRVQIELVDIGRTLGMRESAIVWRIVLPAAAPGIWDAARSMLGWAWSWLILAELVGAAEGFGYRLARARQFFQSDTIFGYLIILGLLGLAMDQAMRFAGRRLFRWAEARR